MRDTMKSALLSLHEWGGHSMKGVRNFEGV